MPCCNCTLYKCSSHIYANPYVRCRHTTQAEVELQLGKTRLQLERTRGTVAELRRALSNTQQAQASAIATAALNDARAESASIAAALSNGGLQSRDEHLGWGTTAAAAAVSPARAQRSHNGHAVEVGSPRYSDAAAVAAAAVASPHSGSMRHSRQRRPAAGTSSGLKNVAQKIDAVLLSDGDAAVRSRARRPLARTSSNTAEAAGTATAATTAAATAAGAASSASQRQSTGLLSRGGAARVKTRHRSSRQQ
jgi:hypothetical protein